MLVILGRPNLKMSWGYLVLRLMMERELCSKQLSSVLCKAILAAPALSVHKVVDHWIEEGNEVTRSVIASTMFHLHKRQMFESALEFSEWLELEGHEFGERDYASRVDLIAKVHGLQKTESYIANIPKSFQGEVVYHTLLANCVPVANVKKAEEVFSEMKDLGFPITNIACNQLLFLYKRSDKKKIADVLLLMEKEKVKPSLFTYKQLIDVKRQLIDVKGQSNDITGMEKIVETMKDDGLEPDFTIKDLLAKHYISSGLKERAENLWR